MLEFEVFFSQRLPCAGQGGLDGLFEFIWISSHVEILLQCSGGREIHGGDRQSGGKIIIELQRIDIFRMPILMIGHQHRSTPYSRRRGVAETKDPIIERTPGI